MKKTICLSLCILAGSASSQKAKKVSYDFKQEILPVKLLPTDIKSFDYAIVANEASRQKEIEVGNKIGALFGGSARTGVERYFKPLHFKMMKSALNFLKYKDNKSYGMMGGTAGTSPADQSYKNVSIFTGEANISILLEFGDYELVTKEFKDNTYNLKLNYPGKLTLINNITNQKIDEKLLFTDQLIYNFPLNYNEGSSTPLVFSNKLALDDGLNNALNGDLDPKLRQHLFTCLIKEATSYLNYVYNFNVVNTTIYFAYPKNEKLVEYKNNVLEIENVIDNISKNTGSLNHLNWNQSEIQTKLKAFIEKNENALKLYYEKGKELEMSEEIAEGFKLNLVSAYCLTNNFDAAIKIYDQLKAVRSSYTNEALEIINATTKVNANLTTYIGLFGWSK